MLPPSPRTVREGRSRSYSPEPSFFVRRRVEMLRADEGGRSRVAERSVLSVEGAARPGRDAADDTDRKPPTEPTEVTLESSGSGLAVSGIEIETISPKGVVEAEAIDMSGSGAGALPRLDELAVLDAMGAMGAMVRGDPRRIRSSSMSRGAVRSQLRGNSYTRFLGVSPVGSSTANPEMKADVVDSIASSLRLADACALPDDDEEAACDSRSVEVSRATSSADERV